MPIRHTVLAILNVVPLHGYAIRELTKGYRFFYPMRNSNVYDALRSLESEGFVRHREQPVEGRLRKVYEITDAGRHELRRWLTDTTPQRAAHRDPAALKICLLTPDALEPALPWLQAELERTREEIRRGEWRIAKRAGALTKWTRLGAEYALDLAGVRARWLARVIEEIQSDIDIDLDEY